MDMLKRIKSLLEGIFCIVFLFITLNVANSFDVFVFDVKEKVDLELLLKEEIKLSTVIHREEVITIPVFRDED
jgi:hypothetical protein